VGRYAVQATPRVAFPATAPAAVRSLHEAARALDPAVRLRRSIADVAGSTRSTPCAPRRSSMAPVLVGNYFHTRRLSTFGGDLGAGGRIGHPPVYAFQGEIDELRNSTGGVGRL
jgi:hypothetical protein